MERRKMLNLIGLGGVLTWPGTAQAVENVAPKTTGIRHFATFTQMLKDKKLRSGDLVTTLGYHQVDDGGSAQYKINHFDAVPDTSDLPAGTFQLQNKLVAQLINVKSVNYAVFGARGDGETQDGNAILAAHQYANVHNLPVHNLSGAYRIGGMRNIPVETSVQWGHSVFYIDEKRNTSKPVFHVRSKYEPVTIESGSPAGRSVVENLRPGVQVIPELADYKNHLIHLRDDKDRIAFRAGANYSKSGRPREELVYVSQEGRILGDVAWSFKSTVTITAYPAEDSYLIVEGGTFYLSGESPVDPPSSYTHNGILVTRSRTRINNQWMGIEPGRSDDSLIAQSGFYYFSKAYDVQLNDIRLIPREQNRPGEDRDVPHGTYGIGGNGVLEFSMTGVVAEGTGTHWGVLGTNMMKNVTLKDCRINRFDVHFHLWNLNIRDTDIGYRGLTVTGGGRLHIENTSCYQHQFVNFRRDYGAKWDGDIYISNCTLKPPSSRESTVLYFVASDFEYGYPIGMARSITVKDFLVDYSSTPENDASCWLIKTAPFSITSSQERLFFPASVRFQHIRVTGRQKGVRVAYLKNPSGFYVEQKGHYDGDRLHANSHWELDHVDLESPDAGKDPFLQTHIMFDNQDVKNGTGDNHAPYFNMVIRNCRHLIADLSGAPMQLLIEDSTVHYLRMSDGSPAKGQIHFNRCSFVPLNANDQGTSLFELDATLGTTLTNCVIHLPLNSTDLEVDRFSVIPFIEINKSVKYNHVNTRLSNGFMQFLEKHEIQLNEAFKKDLMLHSSR